MGSKHIFSKLKAETGSHGGTTFQGPAVSGSLQCLASDLWRLRIWRTDSDSSLPSWAVCKHDWPGAPFKASVRRSQFHLQTDTAAFSLNLRTGAWRIIDPSGMEILGGAPGSLGFDSEQAHCAWNLHPREHLAGLGESTGPWNKRGRRVVLWNADILGHAPGMHPGLENLYVSIPFVISLRDGRAAGVFWDNPSRQTWDLGYSDPDLMRVTADHGEVDLYFFLGPTLAQVVERYTELTGRIPMPPKWALGYHQCRHSYGSAKELLQIARTFRRKQIPCDALYLDIDHLRDYRVFSFGRSFPRPAQTLRALRKLGFRVVTIVDPGVKDDPAFGVLRRGRKQNAFVKNGDGSSDVIAKVWPGPSRFPDFLHPQVRAWWGKEQGATHQLGVAGFWNDMNEPAVFDLPGKTLPHDSQHCDGERSWRHARVHNLYGSLMAQASREGALAHQPHERPFIVTRAGYSGVQRHAAVWTGDNSSHWEHLAETVPMLLNLSLSGVPFCGSDVGGFMGNATGELLVRWMQLGVFTPFFRNHSNTGTRRQEPWAFGPEVEGICRAYIQLRYQLLPYLYTLFLEAHRQGTPILRPMAWQAPHDSTALAIGDQFMLGPSLLVAPILQQGATARTVYLPAGVWYDFWSGELLHGRSRLVAEAPLDLIPLYVRAGSILPLGGVRHHTSEPESAVPQFHLWPGTRGDLLWYEDDGATAGQADSDFHERWVRFRALSKRRFELVLEPAQGSYRSRAQKFQIIVHDSAPPKRIHTDGKPVCAQYSEEERLLVFDVPTPPTQTTTSWLA